MKIPFPEVGYTPKNFDAAVNATGLSNVNFMKKFGVGHAAFYKYRNGDRSMSWRTWDVLYKDIKKFMENKDFKVTTFKSKGVETVTFLIKEITPKRTKNTVEADVCLEVSHEGKTELVELEVLWNKVSQEYELMIGKNKGVDAIKRLINSFLAVKGAKKTNNAEFLLDIERYSANIHNAILKNTEKVINAQRRKR